MDGNPIEESAHRTGTIAAKHHSPGYFECFVKSKVFCIKKPRKRGCDLDLGHAITHVDIANLGLSLIAEATGQ